MSNEVENVEKVGKEIRFSEILYVFCRNIIWIVLLFAVILGAGFGFAYTSKDYYVAESAVNVKVKQDPSATDYKDSQLAQMYVPTVADIMVTDAFIQYTQEQFRSHIGDENASISVGNFTVAMDLESGSTVINLRYRDADAKMARKKLAWIVRCIAETANMTTETADGTYENMYFGAAAINVMPFLFGESGDLDTIDDSKLVPTVHTSSDKAKIILISVGLGVFAVVILTFALLIFGDKVSSVAKLESVTGKKNFITIEKKRFMKKSKKDNLTDNSEPSFLRFKVNKLSDTLIYLKDGEKNKVYQVQSGASGEGKTTVTVNLAINLGSDARKTLIIDCDFSHPTVHHAFNISKKVGITDYFKGDISFDGLVKATPFKNVDIITCGDHIYDHTIFFTSDKFKNIINEARKRYDFILLDCAPVKALSDYISISPLVDATLLVVESDRTSARDLKYIVDELQSCNANLVGTIFNFSSASFGKEYYYYYHKNKEEEPKTIMEELQEEANEQVEKLEEAPKAIQEAKLKKKPVSRTKKQS